jgi:lysozyme
LNTVFLFASGVLLVYLLFRFIKKKQQAIPSPTTGYRPTPLAPLKNNLSYDEIYQLIRKEEGFNPVAVRDGSDKNGNPLFTIGIGHQIKKGEEYLLTKRITEDESIILFEKDITEIIEDMNKNIKVPINKNQQLALISLRYNIGPAFNTSSLLKDINQNNFTGAALKFKDWRLSDGKINPVLVARRERERVLFSKPI